MKEFKYTIDGKEYKVQIEDVEGNIADVTVNGEAFKVEMEQELSQRRRRWCSVSRLLRQRKARQQALLM